MTTFQPRFRTDTVNTFLSAQQDQMAAQRAQALQALPEWMRLSFSGPHATLDQINAAAHQYGMANMNRPRYGQGFAQNPNRGTVAPLNHRPATRPTPYPMNAGVSFNPNQSFGVAGRLRSAFQRNRSAYPGY